MLNSRIFISPSEATQVSFDAVLEDCGANNFNKTGELFPERRLQRYLKS